MTQESYRLELQQKPKDKFGYLTLDHAWDRYKKTGSAKINKRLYLKVIKLYFEKVFAMLLDGKTFELPNIGDLYVGKILCTSFNPKSYASPDMDVDRNDGFFYFIMWERREALRGYKMRVARKWKKQIAKIFANTDKDTIEVYG